MAGICSRTSRRNRKTSRRHSKCRRNTMVHRKLYFRTDLRIFCSRNPPVRYTVFPSDNPGDTSNRNRQRLRRHSRCHRCTSARHISPAYKTNSCSLVLRGTVVQCRTRCNPARRNRCPFRIHCKRRPCTSVPAHRRHLRITWTRNQRSRCTFFRVRTAHNRGRRNRRPFHCR